MDYIQFILWGSISVTTALSAEVPISCDRLHTSLGVVDKGPTARTVCHHERGWDDYMPSDVLGLQRLDECLRLVKDDPAFYHCFPKKNATAGLALQHCLSQVSTILKREYPCVYKFGYTHCLSWRFKNPIYGYQSEKYQYMVAVFVSGASIGAALMEAMLIKEYMGLLFKL